MPYKKIMEDEKPLSDKVKGYVTDLYNQGKQLLSPANSEADSLNEKNKNIQEYENATQTKTPAPAPAPQKYPIDQINPTRHYGDRPGEKMIDTREMLKPLGQGTPVYDEGGEVKEGDVNINDGKHQEAVLEDGERVLTPEETEKYDKEHGQAGAPQMVAENTMPSREPIVPKEQSSDIKPMPSIPQPVAPANTDNKQNPMVGAAGGAVVNAQGSPEALNKAIIPPDQGGQDIKQPSYQPGQEPIAPAPDPKEIFRKQKEEAAKKGDLIGLGSAIIGEKALAPDKMPQGPAPVLDTEVKTPKEFKDRIAQYKHAYQMALDEFTPEGKARAANIKEAMLNMMREHPYGSDVNHPGVLGKIEHGLSEVGQIAGEALVPRVVAGIPGTQANMNAKFAGAEEMGKEASEEQLKAAQAAVGKSGQRYQYETIKDAQGNTRGVIVDKLNRTSEPVPGTEGGTLLDPTKLAKHNLELAMKSGDPKLIDQAENELVNLDPTKADEYLFDQTVKSLADNKLIDSSSVSDPKAVKSAIDQGLSAGVVTPRQAAGYTAYAAKHPDAAGKVQINLTEGADAQRRALENKVIGHDVVVQTPRGFEEMPYDEAKKQGFTVDQMEPLQGGQAKKNQDEMANAVDVKRTMVQYRDDLDNMQNQITDDDRQVYRNLVKNDAKVAGELSGIIGDIPVVGPLSEAVNKNVQSWMTEKGYDNLSPAGQKIMADYWSAIIANFQDTKRRLGGVGRNPDLVLAEMHNISLPYLSADNALGIMDQRLDSLDARNHLLNRVRGEHPDDIVSKTRAKQPAQQNAQPTPTATTPAAPAATEKPVAPAAKPAPTTRPRTTPETKVNIPTPASHRFRIEPKGKPAIYSNDGKIWYDKDGKQVK